MRYSLAVPLVLAVALPARAQIATTNCRALGGGMVTCTTQQQGVVTLRDYTAETVQQFGNALGNFLQIRRQRQAYEAYRREVEAYNTALAQASAREREQSDLALRAAELEKQREAAEAEEVESARRQLFAERAQVVLIDVLGSFRIAGVVRDTFVVRATSSLGALYKVNPSASQAQILEAILPTYQLVQQALKGFMAQRFGAVQASLDSLKMTDAERERWAAIAVPSIERLFMMNPWADTAAFRLALRPAADSVVASRRR